MALIACPECGQKISSETPACMHCGMPIDPRRTKVDYVTGEVMGVRPRPAAYAAHRPRRYPTSLAVTVMALGAALVVVGSFMPWVMLGPRSVSGLESDGRVTVVVGGLMLIVALASRTSASRLPRSFVAVGALIAIVVAAVDNSRLRADASDNLIGAGLRIVLIGGVVALVGTLLRSR